MTMRTSSYREPGTFGYRAFLPTHPELVEVPGWAGGKSEIRNPKSEVQRINAFRISSFGGTRCVNAANWATP